MEKALTKYFWIFNILTLAAVAYLSASGTSEIVAAEIGDILPKAKGPTKTRASRPRTATKLISVRNGDDILSRNMFDSVTGPIDRNGNLDEEMMDEALPTGENGLPVVPCPGTNVKLLATVAADESSDWSFASISENGTETRLCRVGDEIDGRTVSRIFWQYIFLKGASDECYIGLFDDGKPPKKPTPPRVVGARAKSADDDIKNGIQVISETERMVDRSVVDKLIANPTQFIRSVRVRPFRQDGKVVGFKLRRFKSDSPLALLGAQKGDVIHSVNGVDLTSVDKALGAYQNLRSTNQLTFSITRNGKPLELNIGIR